MARTKTQQDIVNEELGPQLSEVTEKLMIPGIQTLHTKTTEEIGETLAMVLKSRPNITKLSYTVGKCIELTTSAT